MSVKKARRKRRRKGHDRARPPYQTERYYGDAGRKLREGEPDAAARKGIDSKHAKSLRRGHRDDPEHPNHAVADGLDECRPGRRCGGAYCRQCSTAWARYRLDDVEEEFRDLPVLRI